MKARLYILACVIASFSGKVGAAVEILIDDFSVGPIEVVLSKTTPLRIDQSGLDASHVLFGNRSAAADPFERPRGEPLPVASMTVNTDRQEFMYQTESPLEAFALSYRKSEGDVEYADFSAPDGSIVVDFGYFTSPSELRYDLILSMFASGTLWEQSLPLSKSTTPFQLVYDLDSATIDLSSVTTVSLQASASPSGEFAIRTITFVPELASVTTLAVGLVFTVAVSRTRRNRKTTLW